MQTAAEYLQRTESAVRRLFEGIDAYLTVLRNATGIVFLSSEPPGPIRDAEFEAWRASNSEKLAAKRRAEREFIAESFALDTLCGAVFQVAEKALEMYSLNTTVPSEWTSVVKSTKAKFCVGRIVRTVPLGLIIHGARNQHAHFNEKLLHEPSATVFKRLAGGHGYPSPTPFVDPAFDINNPGRTSYASNVLALIKWQSYERYEKDMEALLELTPQSRGTRARAARAPHCER